MNETNPLESGYRPQPETSALAIWSMVLGILSVTCLTILSGIPGVICGHIALSNIRHSRGAVVGQGLAIAGLVTGYLGILFRLCLIPLLLAIVIPNFVKARDMAQTNGCLNNLREIDAAKNRWAFENRKKTGEVPTVEDLKPYFKNGVFPACPAGGAYSIGAIGDDPACSNPKHRLLEHRMGGEVKGPCPNYNTTDTPATPRVVAAPQATWGFIPAPYRTDMVHDSKRNQLCISAGSSVLLYETASNIFLSPLELGGDLRGIDISPDNDLLAVADASDNNGNIGIHLVDMKTGTDTHVTFPAERNEGGTYSVAFGADNGVWITSTFHGSGEVPLRKYSSSDKRANVVAHIGQNTMLAASADREYIAYAEANSSSGYYGRCGCRATRLQPPLQANASLYEIGISRDGSQLAVPTYNKVVLSGAALQMIDEHETLGAAYHPRRDFLFLARGGVSTIAVYETSHYSIVKELDFGERFEWIGNNAFQRGRLRLSNDGKLIFCTVQGGIRYAETGL